MKKIYFKTEEEQNTIIEDLKQKGIKAFIVGFDNVRF